MKPGTGTGGRCGGRASGRPPRRRWIRIWAAVLAAAGGVGAAQPEPPFHPSVRERFVPADVAWTQPLYVVDFDREADLAEWRLEGGKRVSIADGRLVLESEPGRRDNHLVCWLTRELPADFLLEFAMRPQNREEGLTILFFGTRGTGGRSVFDPTLQPRNGVFRQYHSGDLNGYHVSYWAGERGTANIRKNAGFKLVATGPDLVRAAPAGRFQTIRVYKRGGTIRVMVDDTISVAFDDDGITHGPVWNQAGWIGLRHMGHTVRSEYEYLKVYPLRAAAGK